MATSMPAALFLALLAAAASVTFCQPAGQPVANEYVSQSSSIPVSLSVVSHVKSHKVHSSPLPYRLAPRGANLTAAGVIPTVITGISPNSTVTCMHLLYNNTPIDGTLLRPSQAVELPEIRVAGADSARLYTLVVVDLGGPDPATPTSAQILHALIDGIPGANVPAGTVVTAFVCQT